MIVQEPINACCRILTSACRHRARTAPRACRGTTTTRAAVQGASRAATVKRTLTTVWAFVVRGSTHAARMLSCPTSVSALMAMQVCVCVRERESVCV